MNLFPQVHTKLYLIIVVPDEALRHTQIVVARICYFTFYDMDVIIFRHAQGLLTYNNIEQQITPLSSKLTLEIILPFDIFRCHLNSQNKTVDEDLEKQHCFQAARKILAEIWNDGMIDGHSVIAKYIDLSEQPRQQIVTEIEMVRSTWTGQLKW